VSVRRFVARRRRIKQKQIPPHSYYIIKHRYEKETINPANVWRFVRGIGNRLRCAKACRRATQTACTSGSAGLVTISHYQTYEVLKTS
jgi:hypothetical protein